MSDKIITTTIEILGKPYPIRCQESELQSLQKAAEFLNQQMLEVQESGKAINVERIAIITALNISYKYLQSDNQKTSLVNKVNQRIVYLQDKLDHALSQIMQAELLYTTE
jgi:cell division protein ZapA